jgi:glutamate racemase
VAATRIAAVSCHGLATAIERDVDGPRVGELIAMCASDVRAVAPAGSEVLLGLCCTHYGYVSERLTSAVAGEVGRDVTALNPNARMVDGVMAGLVSGGAGPVEPARPAVEVVSKVMLDERTRSGIAALVRPVSPATAEALRGYRHAPNLF